MCMYVYVCVCMCMYVYVCVCVCGFDHLVAFEEESEVLTRGARGLQVKVGMGEGGEAIRRFIQGKLSG